MSEFAKSSVAFTHISPCRILRVTFNNANAAQQSLVFSRASLPSSQGEIKLWAGITSPIQFDFGGYPFPDGFTCTPSSADITDIIVEYEDIKT